MQNKKVAILCWDLSCRHKPLFHHDSPFVFYEIIIIDNEAFL